ncbi:MAG: alpha-glucosidase, partial [Thalassolituus oleivorans]
MAFKWWQTGVVYQIYPRSFQDSNGDGIGDLEGIISRMEYIADLGVDAIWVSPFFTSPMADFGYDVADYCDVDPIFGTLADADRLIQSAHAHGLKVLLDYIPNHCSDRHEWFQEALSSRDSPRRDWFVWRDPKPDGTPPNNWLSVFGGPGWTLDQATGQYFRHSFLKEQPDLDWRNPEVVEAMHDVLRFWLDRGVDGFRLDAILFAMRDPNHRDNPASPKDAPGSIHKEMGAWDKQLHIHDSGHEDIHGVFAGWRRVVDAHVPPGFGPGDPLPDRVLIGEIHEFDVEKWAAYYGEAGQGLHMPFNFGLLKAPWTAAGVRHHVESIEKASHGKGWPNYVLGNHDDKRLATRLGPESTHLAAMLLLTLRGTPTLYYGDELGMEEAEIPAAMRQDPWGINVPGLGRDGCRTPMQWQAGQTGGFTTGVPWLPVSSDGAFRNVLLQTDEPDSLLNLYRRLLRLRRKHPSLHRGTFTS